MSVMISLELYIYYYVYTEFGLTERIEHASDMNAAHIT